MDTERRRPGDTWRQPNWWQAQEGQGDGRWGTQAVRYTYMNAQCRYCGNHCEGPAGGVTAHPRALCLACGTPQCADRSTCLVCMAGYVGSPPWNEGTCGRARCDGRAVAKAPRVRRVCLAHLQVTPVLIAGARITVADGITAAVLQRDRGGQDWQKLTWFGPPKRYAVRRWHDDGRTGWTTGADLQGFETAGQADREADAWRRSATGWTAERVELTSEVRQQIAERYPDAPKYEPPDPECAACGDPVEDATSELCDSCTVELAEED